MKLFDTHCHLDLEEFETDRSDVIRRAQEAGVSRLLTVAVTAESSVRTVALAESCDSIHAAVGIHPNYCSEVANDDWDRVAELTKHKRVVALGETGLDFYRDHAPREIQIDYFDRHLRLSRQLGLPFIVHTRGSEKQVLEMLREAARRGPLRGIMHSFTGDESMAAECLELGMHISFAGMVTFKKSDDLRRVAKTIPDDRLLIETDSPYLSPHPVRGGRNEPARVVHTATCLAAVRDRTVEQIAGLTTDNALRLFRIAE